MKRTDGEVKVNDSTFGSKMTEGITVVTPAVDTRFDLLNRARFATEEQIPYLPALFT